MDYLEVFEIEIFINKQFNEQNVSLQISIKAKLNFNTKSKIEPILDQIY